ncbi:MAG: histidine kinase [Alcanivoracaceae bacterium]|nr:histidine kinase [Alcanivoracaceae bacterium]
MKNVPTLIKASEKLLLAHLPKPASDLARLITAIFKLDGGWLFWAFFIGWVAWLFATITLILHPEANRELVGLALLSSGVYVGNALRLSGALLRHPTPGITDNHDGLNWCALILGHGCAVIIMRQTQASGADAFALSMFSVLYAPYLNRLSQMPAMLAMLSSSTLIGWSSALEAPWILAGVCAIQQSVVWLVGRSFLDQRAASKHFRTLHKRLEQAQQELYEASRLAERLRLSREFHDRLGHEITSLNTQLIHLEQQDKSAKTSAHLHEAKLALQRLDQCFRDILTHRPPAISQPLLNDIHQLVQQIPSLRIAIENAPHSIAVSDRTQQTVMICLGEALTNCLKHSASEKISLQFEQHDKLVCLRITNAASRTRTGESGMGLDSMHQRMLAIGGQFVRFRPSPYLFVAELYFPAEIK